MVAAARLDLVGFELAVAKLEQFEAGGGRTL